MNKDQIHQLFIYEDGALRWRDSVSPRACAGDIAGTLANTGYVVIGVDSKRYLAHRLVFLLHHGYMPQEVDHIDGDRANNRIENLRAATRKQNQYNAALRTSNTSGVKGVYWYKQTSKWAAQCKVNGKLFPLGYFTDMHDAANAVAAFRELHHGEYANHG